MPVEDCYAAALEAFGAEPACEPVECEDGPPAPAVDE
jgi:hypothetical protein